MIRIIKTLEETWATPPSSMSVFFDERVHPEKWSNVCQFSQVVPAELPYPDFSLVPLKGKSPILFWNLKFLVFPIKVNYSTIYNVGYCFWVNKSKFDKMLYLDVSYLSLNLNWWLSWSFFTVLWTWTLLYFFSVFLSFLMA